MLNNRDYNIDQNNRDYDFCHNRAALEPADDVSSLHKQGAQRYANTYFDRQAGQPIVMFGPSILIGRTFYGPTPFTEDINTYK